MNVPALARYILGGEKVSRSKARSRTELSPEFHVRQWTICFKPLPAVRRVDTGLFA